MPIFEKQSVYTRTAFPTFHTTPGTPFTWEPSKLHVLSAITNPCRYSSRYHLFEKFEKMVLGAGAQLWVVEAAFGNRPHVVTRPDNPRHVQLRTWHELWLKENLLNIGMSRLPSDWEYVAWIDPDVAFARPDWVNETLNQLQHYSIVQMFSHSHDLSPDQVVMRTHTGFAHRYQTGGFPDPVPGLTVTTYEGTHRFPARVPYYAHPGYAWAARRQAIEDLGGLLDQFIVGSADYHMAHALIGQAALTVNPGWSQALEGHLLQWQERAEQYVRRNVGTVPGSLLHFWHGPKSNRRYQRRNSILVKHGYDPRLDLKRDSQGLWQLTDRSIGLRDALRAYLRSRNEDSIDAS